jgi:hypothetical protein
MIEKFDDLNINYRDRTIVQRMTLLMFLPIILVLIILIVLFLFANLKGGVLIMVGILFISITIAFSNQFISTTIVKIGDLKTEVVKSYVFGLIRKKEIINTESISFSIITTQEYDDNGKKNGVQKRSWLISSEYSDVNFLRLRNEEKEKKFKKIMSRVLKREIENRNIFLSKK